MPRRPLLLLALLAAAGLALVADGRLRGLPSVDDAVLAHDRETTARRRAALHATGVYGGDPGWTPLTDARESEWLFHHPEEGQTFEEFVAFDPLRRTPGRERFVLQPLTPLRPHAEAALEVVREQCALFFAAEAALAPPLDLPAAARDAARGQADSAWLLDWLAARRPEGALVYAGVADEDLFVRGLDNYVFGLGRFREGLGVYSYHRFHHPGVDERLYLTRAFKLLTHEVGHGFGLKHCVYFRCVMNGSNALPELDASPLEPCPVCLRKLQHSLGFDVRARWAALAAFYERRGLADDAAWLRERLTRLEAAGRAAPWADPPG
ncbi:MAG: archaemetzincin [Planctomycetes bacterium]|nr:archaemetzincin [Planctomycetota bacterium]